MKTLHESALSLKLLHRGKVRDMYALDAAHLLIVTTDRLSAFDVILPDAIPHKGAILTRVADFWFKHLSHIIPNQLANFDLKTRLTPDDYAQVSGQAIVVKKLKPLPIEAIVRGYVIGSGWKDYQKTGQICGIELPKNLKLAEKLPEPIFTPSTKAAMGAHDENIDFAQMRALIGDDLAQQVREKSIALYTAAADYAKTRGIIIADTKFEFGLDDDGVLHLIDEVLTPDSSRFWPEDQYQVGISPPSFDKQFVRDYLESLPDWNKQAPAPTLPADIITKTTEKYLEAEKRLLG